MTGSDHYNFDEWTKYYKGTIEEYMREQMEEHLLGCDECMNIYLSVVENDADIDLISLPSQNFTKNVMNKLPEIKVLHKKEALKQLDKTMFYYVSAASIAIMLTLSGSFSYVNSSITKISATVDTRNYSKRLAYSGWSQRLTDKTSNIINSLVPDNKNR